ncbi:MAG: energy transducer TonB [Bacillota bacterium]
MLTTLKKMSPFVVSLALHLGVFALLTLQLQHEEWAPKGVHKKGGSSTELVEVKISSPVEVQKGPTIARPSLSPAGNVSVTHKKSSSGKSRQLGHTTGKVSSGPLGESKGAISSAKERYLYELHVLIEGRKVYPVMSRRLHEAGRVVVQFTVEKNGTIKDVTVKEGTAYLRLNEAARDLIAGVKKYKPLPAELAAGDAKLEISIDYTLK